MNTNKLKIFFVHNKEKQSIFNIILTKPKVKTNS